MKFKLTSLEKKWVLYDVGNSAFTSDGVDNISNLF